MSYTTGYIIETMGVTRECLKEWLMGGFIQPGIQKANGRGTKNLFNREDLYKIYLFKHLVEIGFTRKLAKHIVATYEEKIFPPIINLKGVGIVVSPAVKFQFEVDIEKV